MKKVAKISFNVWAICVLVFLINLLSGTNFFTKAVTDTSYGQSNIFVLVMIISVIFGVVSFLFGAGLLSIILFRKHKPFRIGTLIILILMFTAGGVFASKAIITQTGSIPNPNWLKVGKIPNSQLTTTPTPVSTIAPSPIPTKKPYVNPDPIVNCGPGVNSKQYVKDKQSNCKNYVDCGFSNNVWTLMLKTECDKKQAEQGTQSTQVQKPTNPTGQLNFYCYNNTLNYSYYTSSGEQCNKDNLISSCKGLVKSTYDLCMKTCLDTSHENISMCGSAYLGSQPIIEYSEALYNECIDENTKEHQTCMDACGVPYQENSSKCNF